jgi:hypothetical protein
VPFVARKSVLEREARAAAEEYAALGVEAEVAVVEHVRNRLWGPTRSDRLLFAEAAGQAQKPREWREVAVRGERRGIHGEFEIELQACAQCETVGTLAGEDYQELNAACPRCHTGTLAKIGFWIT